MGLSVRLVLLANLDALYQTQEGGTVKFLKLGIIPHQVQLVIVSVFVLPVSLQLRCKLHPLFQLVLTLCLITVQKLDAQRLRLASFTLSS